MEEFSQDDFDQTVSHAIRIELKDGTILHYSVTPKAKKAFRNQLLNDAVSIYDKDFLWFYIPEDRLVLINEEDIVRITFCFDASVISEAEYSDNFKVFEKLPQENEMDEDGWENEMDDPGNELDLPQLIIKHRREKEDSEIVEGVTMKTEGFYGNVSCYFDMSENQVSGFGFDFYDDVEEWILLASKYLQFIDEDGEENFMRIKSLSLIEIKRSFIMSDETLDKYLDGKTG